MNKLYQLLGALFLGGLGVALATVLPIGLLLYWLRTDFGKEYALAFFIAVVVVGSLVIGFWLAGRNTKRTLEAASDFAHDMASAQKAQAGVARDYARIELEAARAQLRSQTIDAQAVHRLAEQRARLLAAPAGDEEQPAVYIRQPGQTTGFTIYE